MCLQLTDAVEEVARVMHCAAQANLSLTEETLMRLVLELSSSLNSLMRQLSHTVWEHILSSLRPFAFPVDV